jgi:hypothetical protein
MRHRYRRSIPSRLSKRRTAKDVPVDALRSITVYNAEAIEAHALG